MKTKSVPTSVGTLNPLDVDTYAEINNPNRFPPLEIKYLILARKLHDLGEEHCRIRNDPSFPRNDDPEESWGDLEGMINKASEAAWNTGLVSIWVTDRAKEDQ